MSKRPTLVFFGNERLATAVKTDAPTLRALVAAGYHVAAVVTNHSEAISRQKRELEIVAVAHAYHIPVLMPDNLVNIADKLKGYGAEAAVLVAYGKIIPKSIIDIFPKGIINIHPSLLPKMRGSTPVEMAILDGLDKTGVSLMSLSAEMDAGPVYSQQEQPLSGIESKQELATSLLNLGVELLIKNLDDILAGNLKPKVQDETEATYTRLLTKQDGHLNFDLPAEKIERQVRAYLGFPKSRTEIFGREVVITNARVADGEDDGELVLKFNPGYLEVKELIAPSGRSMSGADFIRGYKKS